MPKIQNYLSPKRYIYALFERARIGKWKLFPLGVYQRIALAINLVAFRREIAEAQASCRAQQAKQADADATKAPFAMVDGHRTLHARQLPHGLAALEVCRELANTRGNTNDQRLNPYSLAGTSELLAQDAIREFLTSDALIAVACDYLGTYPKITAVNLLESRPREGGPQGSQNYHLDNIAPRVVRLVLHVSDVQEKNGPFTYFPAAESERLEREVGYRRRFDYGEISPEELEAVEGAVTPHRAIGESGAVLLVDTCRCLHFGSRVKRGLRHVLMATYAAPPYTNLRWMAGLE